MTDELRVSEINVYRAEYQMYSSREPTLILAADFPAALTQAMTFGHVDSIEYVGKARLP